MSSKTEATQDSSPRACSRREFLRASAAACAAASIVPVHVLGADGGRSPTQKVTLAGVGIGGVGHGQLQECAKAGFQIVALCDVDSVYAKKTFDLWPQARRYQDFREMLATEGDKVDAVYCGTPDHTHALITLAALHRKKHVCCVKPLTRTIHELRVVVEAAQKAGVATQVTAAPNTDEAGCRATELIQAGVLGAVRELHLWSNRPVWPQGMTRPPGEDPVPAELDWKLWLGPAPARPFKHSWSPGDYALAQMNLKDWDPGVKGVYHPFNFRGWWDFGTGALGDMGCHHFNTPFRALKLGAPSHIEASSTKVFSESAPLASMVTFEYGARGSLPPLRAIWYDGGLRPPQPSAFKGQAWPAEGTLYVGDQGCLLNTWEGIKVAPNSAAKQAESVPRTLPRRGGTWSEWFTACQGGETAGCNFSLAGPLTETVLLGNVAIRVGKRLEWDSSRMQFGAEDANRFLREPYQNGWALETI
jgi:predicted dehydrogenase